MTRLAPGASHRAPRRRRPGTIGFDLETAGRVRSLRAARRPSRPGLRVLHSGQASAYRAAGVVRRPERPFLSGEPRADRLRAWPGPGPRQHPPAGLSRRSSATLAKLPVRRADRRGGLRVTRSRRSSPMSVPRSARSRTAPRLWHPRHWPSWVAVGLVYALGRLPFPADLGLGPGAGASRLPAGGRASGGRSGEPRDLSRRPAGGRARAHPARPFRLARGRLPEPRRRVGDLPPAAPAAGADQEPGARRRPHRGRSAHHRAGAALRGTGAGRGGLHRSGPLGRLYVPAHPRPGGGPSGAAGAPPVRRASPSSATTTCAA